jgi:hypothetical protein
VCVPEGFPCFFDKKKKRFSLLRVVFCTDLACLAVGLLYGLGPSMKLQWLNLRDESKPQVTTKP